MTKAKPKGAAELIGDTPTPMPISVRDYDAAAMLGVSAETLRNWRKAGPGPVYSRLSSHAVVYPVDELRSFVYRNLVGSEGADE